MFPCLTYTARMNVRQYLTENPEVVAQLRSRSLLAKGLALQLGVTAGAVSKVLGEMNTPILTGTVTAARREASNARRERDVHLEQLAQAVLDGKLNVDAAAEQGGCSRDTIWRRVRKRKNGNDL